MSEVILVVVKGTGLVLTGLSREAGGPTPMPDDLLGRSSYDGLGRFPVTLGSATFQIRAENLDVVRVPGVAADVSVCVGKVVSGDPPSELLTEAPALVATWVAPNLTVTGGVATAVVTKHGERITLKGGSPHNLPSLSTPFAVLADGLLPHIQT